MNQKVCSTLTSDFSLAASDRQDPTLRMALILGILALLDL